MSERPLLVISVNRNYKKRTPRHSPDTARHISTAPTLRHSIPTELRRSHRKCDRNHRNSGALCPRQLPTICGPIFARFCLFPPIISTLSPPVAHHLLRIAPRCTFYFVYLFLIVCLHDHHIFSYLNLFHNTLLLYITVPGPVTLDNPPVITYSHIQPSFPIVSRTI